MLMMPYSSAMLFWIGVPAFTGQFWLTMVDKQMGGGTLPQYEGCSAPVSAFHLERPSAAHHKTIRQFVQKLQCAFSRQGYWCVLRKHIFSKISSAHTGEQQEPLDVKRLDDAPRMPLAALQAVPCRAAGLPIIM